MTLTDIHIKNPERVVSLPISIAEVVVDAVELVLFADPLLRLLPLLFPLVGGVTAEAVAAAPDAVAITDVVVGAEDVPGGNSGSAGWPALRKIRFMDDTEGIELGSQTLCANNWSRISHANNPGLSDFKRKILFTTDGVATCYIMFMGEKQTSFSSTFWLSYNPRYIWQFAMSVLPLPSEKSLRKLCNFFKTKSIILFENPKPFWPINSSLWGSNEMDNFFGGSSKTTETDTFC
jgi:hypothetical protein